MLRLPRFKLSPEMQRRGRRFKANRRGYWCLWIFLILFTISLFAEFVANDRPLLVGYEGRIYLPIFVDYPESDFGGFYASTDYRDPFVAKTVREHHGFMLWPPIRFGQRTINKSVDAAFPSPPSAQNLLGTDDTGRDVLARLIYGFRTSVLFGLALTVLSTIVGIAAGAIQGYFGGWTDLLMQRFIEIWTSVPQLYVIIIIAAVIEPSFIILLGILLLFSWVSLVGYVRAEFLRGRKLEYVTAARAMGLGNLQIMIRHVLPNALIGSLTFLPFLLSSAISTLTSLDFLGLGLPPGSPSLGEMLSQARNNLQAPWIGITAFAALALLLSLLIFIGEALRDAFDPRMGDP
ncbi:MAG TPA: ABC transporter permease [Steroidobacteraceae bacterium]|nr:ABC transporter permease [Steroidobacteraceae bacterium]